MREGFAEWILAQEASGATLVIDPKIRNETFTIDWKSMTVDELEALHEKLKAKVA